MDNHYTEYALQTLLYIARLCAFEEYDCAIRLGLRADQIDAIRALSVQEIHELAPEYRDAGYHGPDRTTVLGYRALYFKNPKRGT